MSNTPSTMAQDPTEDMAKWTYQEVQWPVNIIIGVNATTHLTSHIGYSMARGSTDFIPINFATWVRVHLSPRWCLIEEVPLALSFSKASEALRDIKIALKAWNGISATINIRDSGLTFSNILPLNRPLSGLLGSNCPPAYRNTGQDPAVTRYWGWNSCIFCHWLYDQDTQLWNILQCKHHLLGIIPVVVDWAQKTSSRIVMEASPSLVFSA